ncbi:MAG: biopolymer transporter ExbD [Oligoflexia bacterium]|nr:biopolymer transporter ExbD [Oligoflexia bacterium]
MYSDGPRKGNKRQTNMELNLVPFIDLMSTAICFLLISAVWTQVSMIQIGSSIYAKKNDTGQVEQPPREQVQLKIDVTESGYIVSVGKQSLRIPKVGVDWDQAALVTQLKSIKGKYPDKTDGIISLLDDIKYNELIRGMDAFMIAGFPEIAISTQGVK